MYGEVASSTGGSLGRSKRDASLKGEKTLRMGCNLGKKKMDSTGPHPSWKWRGTGYQRAGQASSH